VIGLGHLELAEELRCLDYSLYFIFLDRVVVSKGEREESMCMGVVWMNGGEWWWW